MDLSYDSNPQTYTDLLQPDFVEFYLNLYNTQQQYQNAQVVLSGDKNTYVVVEPCEGNVLSLNDKGEVLGRWHAQKRNEQLHIQSWDKQSSKFCLSGSQTDIYILDKNCKQVGRIRGKSQWTKENGVVKTIMIGDAGDIFGLITKAAVYYKINQHGKILHQQSLKDIHGGIICDVGVDDQLRHIVVIGNGCVSKGIQPSKPVVSVWNLDEDQNLKLLFRLGRLKENLEQTIFSWKLTMSPDGNNALIWNDDPNQGFLNLSIQEGRLQNPVLEFEDDVTKHRSTSQNEQILNSFVGGCWWSNSKFVSVDENGQMNVLSLPGMENQLQDQQRMVQLVEKGWSCCVVPAEDGGIMLLRIVTASEAALLDPSKRYDGVKEDGCVGWIIQHIFQQVTPMEKITKKIKNSDLNGALQIAQVNGIDLDDVYKLHWNELGDNWNSGELEECFNNVVDKTWVIAECLGATKLGSTYEAQQVLLQYGLQLTYNFVSTWGQQENVDCYWVCQRLLLLRSADLLETFYLLRDSKYDVEAFREFQSLDLFAAATTLAQASNLVGLTLILERHLYSLCGRILEILDALPETLDPREYSNLLPALDAQQDLQFRASRGQDVIEDANLVQFLQVYNAIDYVYCTEYSIAMSGAAAFPTQEQIVQWYLSRAQHIDQTTGLFQNSIVLLELGCQRGLAQYLPCSIQHLKMLMENAVLSGKDAQLEDFMNMSISQQLQQLLNEVRAKGVDYFNEEMEAKLKGFINECADRQEVDNILTTFMLKECENRAGLQWSRNLVDVECQSGDPQLFNSIGSLGDAVVVCTLQNATSGASLEDYKHMLSVVSNNMHLSSDNQETQTKIKEVLELIQAAELLATVGLDVPLQKLVHDDDTSAQKCVRSIFSKHGSQAQGSDVQTWEQLFDKVVSVKQKAFPTISYSYILQEYVRALLRCGHFNQAQKYLLDQSRLPKSSSEKIILSCARYILNSAPDITSREVSDAQKCLNLLQSEQLPQPIKEELDFINALQQLQKYQVTAYPPAKVRQDIDQLGAKSYCLNLIQQIVEASPEAVEKYLELQQLAELFGLKNDSDKNDIIIIVARHAYEQGRFKSASNLAQKLVIEKHAPAWKICMDIGSDDRYGTEYNQIRKQLLQFALSYCEKEAMCDLIEQIRKCEKQSQYNNYYTDPESVIQNPEMFIQETLDFAYFNNALSGMPTMGDINACIAAYFMLDEKEKRKKIFDDLQNQDLPFAQNERILMIASFLNQLEEQFYSVDDIKLKAVNAREWIDEGGAKSTPSPPSATPAPTPRNNEKNQLDNNIQQKLDNVDTKNKEQYSYQLEATDAGRKLQQFDQNIDIKQFIQPDNSYKQQILLNLAKVAGSCETTNQQLNENSGKQIIQIIIEISEKYKLDSWKFRMEFLNSYLINLDSSNIENLDFEIDEELIDFHQNILVNQPNEELLSLYINVLSKINNVKILHQIVKLIIQCLEEQMNDSEIEHALIQSVDALYLISEFLEEIINIQIQNQKFIQFPFKKLISFALEIHSLKILSLSEKVAQEFPEFFEFEQLKFQIYEFVEDLGTCEEATQILSSWPAHQVHDVHAPAPHVPHLILLYKWILFENQRTHLNKMLVFTLSKIDVQFVVNFALFSMGVEKQVPEEISEFFDDSLVLNFELPREDLLNILQSVYQQFGGGSQIDDWSLNLIKKQLFKMKAGNIIFENQICSIQDFESMLENYSQNNNIKQVFIFLIESNAMYEVLYEVAEQLFLGGYLEDVNIVIEQAYQELCSNNLNSLINYCQNVRSCNQRVPIGQVKVLKRKLVPLTAPQMPEKEASKTLENMSNVEEKEKEESQVQKDCEGVEKDEGGWDIDEEEFEAFDTEQQQQQQHDDLQSKQQQQVLGEEQSQQKPILSGDLEDAVGWEGEDLDLDLGEGEGWAGGGIEDLSLDQVLGYQQELNQGQAQNVGSVGIEDEHQKALQALLDEESKLESAAGWEGDDLELDLGGDEGWGGEDLELELGSESKQVEMDKEEEEEEEGEGWGGEDLELDLGAESTQVSTEVPPVENLAEGEEQVGEGWGGEDLDLDLGVEVSQEIPDAFPSVTLQNLEENIDTQVDKDQDIAASVAAPIALEQEKNEVLPETPQKLHQLEHDSKNTENFVKNDTNQVDLNSSQQKQTPEKIQEIENEQVLEEEQQYCELWDTDTDTLVSSQQQQEVSLQEVQSQAEKSLSNLRVILKSLSFHIIANEKGKVILQDLFNNFVDSIEDVDVCVGEVVQFMRLLKEFEWNLDEKENKQICVFTNDVLTGLFEEIRFNISDVQDSSNASRAMDKLVNLSIQQEQFSAIRIVITQVWKYGKALLAQPTQMPFSIVWLTYFQNIIMILPNYESYILQTLDGELHTPHLMAYEQVSSLIKFVIEQSPIFAFSIYSLCYPPNNSQPHALINTILDKLKQGNYIGEISLEILAVVLWSGKFTEIVDWVGIKAFIPVIKQLPASPIQETGNKDVDPKGVLFPCLICQMVVQQLYAQAVWITCEQLNIVQNFGSQLTGILIIKKYLEGELNRGMRRDLFADLDYEFLPNVVKSLVEGFEGQCIQALKMLNGLL